MPKKLRVYQTPCLLLKQPEAIEAFVSGREFICAIPFISLVPPAPSKGLVKYRYLTISKGIQLDSVRNASYVRYCSPIPGANKSIVLLRRLFVNVIGTH